MMVKDLKDLLLDGDVSSFAWLPTVEMLADVLTKEMRMSKGLGENSFGLSDVSVNEVKNINSEIRMLKIRNRNKEDGEFCNYIKS